MKRYFPAARCPVRTQSLGHPLSIVRFSPDLLRNVYRSFEVTACACFRLHHSVRDIFRANMVGLFNHEIALGREAKGKKY